jgi:hypothetical protein
MIFSGQDTVEQGLDGLSNLENGMGVLGLETNPGAMQHDLVIDRFGPDGENASRCCHVKAHGCRMPEIHRFRKEASAFRTSLMSHRNMCAKIDSCQGFGCGFSQG